LWETPMDYESLAEKGTALGSGALLIMDDKTSMPEMLLSMLKFFRHESCGKCNPCRNGTDRLVMILERYLKNEGSEEDLNLMLKTADVMNKTCLCALGQSPFIPIRTMLQYFSHEFKSVIRKSS